MWAQRRSLSPRGSAVGARFGRRGRRAPRRPHAPPDAPRRPAKSARARAAARSSVASASWRSVNAGYVADSSRQGRVAGRGGGSRASLVCRRGHADLRDIGGELWSRRWTRQSLKKLRRPNERSPCLQNAGSARGGRARGASPGRERGGYNAHLLPPPTIQPPARENRRLGLGRPPGIEPGISLTAHEREVGTMPRRDRAPATTSDSESGKAGCKNSARAGRSEAKESPGAGT